MRADLSPDDFQGLIQAHRDQVRLRSLGASEDWQPCAPAEDRFMTLGVFALCAAPVVAFLIFLVI